MSPSGGWNQQRWEKLVYDNPPTWWLNEAEFVRLTELAQGFLASKRLDPVGGLKLTEPMRQLLAAQFCLPVLSLGLEWLDNWDTVILYPDTFIPAYVERYEPLDAAGAVVRPGPHSGQSLPNGPVVISWADLKRDLATRDGYAVNVVIHELAHQLDVREGVAFDGLPPLHREMAPREWTRAFTAAYRHLRQVVSEDRVEPPLDPYAAESPAEFFAVACESFFLTPDWLYEDYPPVYDQLRQYFRLDPLVWLARGEPGR